MRQNLVVFMADLFNVLEIHPADCVRYPGMDKFTTGMLFLDTCCKKLLNFFDLSCSFCFYLYIFCFLIKKIKFVAVMC